jgi:spore germination protein YaaH
MTTIRITPASFDVRRSNDGDWSITTAATITDKQAAAITWRANPGDVVLGAYVQVSDAGGLRIGHLATATYHKGWNQPAYVTCGLELC